MTNETQTECPKCHDDALALLCDCRATSYVEAERAECTMLPDCGCGVCSADAVGAEALK